MTKRGTMVKWLGAAALATVVGPGCALGSGDDADRFREAIPQADAVTVPGPEQRAAGNQASQSLTASDEPWANGPWAHYYGFTREVRDGVNHVTGAILGSVWLVVHTNPSTVSEKEAIWGPYTDALEPATWRLRVTEVAHDKYDYFLEGRPKTSDSDSDWVAVLEGTGFGKNHPKHGDGQFTLDLDAARALDPFTSEDTGKIVVEHDLPSDITSNIAALPRVIRADVQPSEGAEWFTVTSTANEDGTGDLLVNAFADADDSQATQPEDIQIQSRWQNDGSGRADITLSGGDIPQSFGVVTAVECWGNDFMRVYYSDSVSYAPTEGDPTACPYAEPTGN